MNIQIQPYLMFDGRCDEALEYYKRALGAKVEMLMRFKDCPDPAEMAKMSPNTKDKVMHAQLRIGEAVILASDGRCTGTPNFQGFSLALTAPDDAAAKKLFAALSDGGKVHMPLAKTFFSSQFGMVADRFGVAWMVLVAH